MKKIFSFKQCLVKIILLLALTVVTSLPAHSFDSNSPVTQFMLVDRSTDDGVLLRNPNKVASLLKQIGFKGSVTRKGMEPTYYTLKANRRNTHILMTCDDMSDEGKCIVTFGTELELKEFIRTLTGTGWTKKGNTYTLSSKKGSYRVVAYVKGKTVTLQSEIKE